ncbi:MAG: hypothetical protein P1U74_07425 [Legionellaceae bacterium]|nr:hypothetical protein [Legionellaceae bacterium]
MPFTKSTYITNASDIPSHIPTAATAKAAIIRPTKNFKIVSEDNPNMVLTLQQQQKYVEDKLATLQDLPQKDKTIKEQEFIKEFQQQLSEDAYNEQQLLINAIEREGIPTRFILEDKTRVVNDSEITGEFEYYTDQIFATDTGQYYDKKGDLYFIPASFRNPQRKDEETLAIAQAQNLASKIQPLQMKDGTKITFEGGDIRQMVGRELFFIGQGHRNDPEAGITIAEASQYIVIPIKLLKEQFYHLDCCFLPLPNDAAVIYEGEYELDQNNQTRLDPKGWPKIIPGTETMAAESRALIRKIYPTEKLVLISKAEALAFATNSAILQNPKNLKFKMFVNGRRNCRILSERQAIETHQLSLHYQTITKIYAATAGQMDIIETPFKTMHGSGGSVRCTILELACANKALLPQKNNQYYFSNQLDLLEEKLQTTRRLNFFSEKKTVTSLDTQDLKTQKQA